jgi:hypothetical protein
MFTSFSYLIILNILKDFAPWYPLLFVSLKEGVALFDVGITLFHGGMALFDVGNLFEFVVHSDQFFKIDLKFNPFIGN